MTLLHWFARKKPSADSAPSSSGHPRADPSHPPEAAPVTTRRGERTARRELLYVVVRECMNSAGVLSSSYKFKVLSLDGWGRQFLVMVDLGGPHLESPQRLAEIEALVAHAAKARHDIHVRAVYWRQNAPAAAGTQPPTLNERVDPHPTRQGPAAAPVVAAKARDDEPFEPINQQELMAFRAALAKGERPQVARPTQNFTLLTGFENTELYEEPTLLRSLSGTQYGDVR